MFGVFFFKGGEGSGKGLVEPLLLGYPVIRAA